MVKLVPFNDSFNNPRVFLLSLLWERVHMFMYGNAQRHLFWITLKGPVFPQRVCGVEDVVFLRGKCVGEVEPCYPRDCVWLKTIWWHPRLPNPWSQYVQSISKVFFWLLWIPISWPPGQPTCFFSGGLVEVVMVCFFLVSFSSINLHETYIKIVYQKRCLYNLHSLIVGWLN